LTACNVNDLSVLTLEVVTYEKGEHVCTLRGVDIYHAHEMCEYTESIDKYVLRLIRPKHEAVGCSVTVDYEGTPGMDAIIEQCGVDAWLNLGNGSASLAFSHQTEQKPPEIVCPAPDLPVGVSLYDQAFEENLWTDKPYTWLAGRLIWYGVVAPDCPGGYSGIDPYTNAADTCGLRATRSKVIEWQNQFDADIYKAAVTSKVPARLLKRMIGIESQFWPLYGIGDAGERGVLQVTELGADTLMRFDATYKPWYPGLSVEDQFWSRLDVRNSFDCPGCDLGQAVDKTRELIPLYARLLAAYRCRAVSITPTLSGSDAWQQAVVDYNGSGEYLLKIEGP
jgi:hypothetical protein